MRRPPDFLARGYAMRAVRWLMERGSASQAEFTREYNRSRAYPGRQEETATRAMSKPSLSFKREFSRFIARPAYLMSALDAVRETTVDEVCTTCKAGGLYCSRCHGRGIVTRALTSEEMTRDARARDVDEVWRVVERQPIVSRPGFFDLIWRGPTVDQVLSSLSETAREHAFAQMEWSMQQDEHAHDTEHFTRWARWARDGRRS